MRVCIAVLLLLGVVLAAVCVRASITPNPDSWELPPAAPNYGYFAQGLVGSGETSTLVTIRDPASTDMAYNTSLFAFSVSGGLVPLNYIGLDAHCMSYVIADILICDPMTSVFPTWPTTFFQLAVIPVSGGGNHLYIADQIDAPALGSWFQDLPPVYIGSSGNVIVAQWDSVTYDNLVVYELDRTNSTGQGLVLTQRGKISNALVGIAGDVFSMTLNTAESQLTFNTMYGQLLFSWPGVTYLNQNFTTVKGWSFRTNGDTALQVTQNAQGNAVLYTTYSLSSHKPTGPVLTDTTTTWFSGGLYFAGSSTSYTPTASPCIYVAGYATQQKSGQYATLSQLKVPTSGSATTSMDAQTTLAANPGNTLVANAGYVFVIIQEIMYRYIAMC